jgi:hypothetical protein
MYENNDDNENGVLGIIEAAHKTNIWIKAILNKQVTISQDSICFSSWYGCDSSILPFHIFMQTIPMDIGNLFQISTPLFTSTVLSSLMDNLCYRKRHNLLLTSLTVVSLCTYNLLVNNSSIIMALAT